MNNPTPKPSPCEIDGSGLLAAKVALRDRWPHTNSNYQGTIVEFILEAYESARAQPKPPAWEGLIKNFKSDGFRKAYLPAHTWLSIANQIRELRGEQSQENYGAWIGKPQSVVARLENPDTPKSLQSLFDVAYAHNLALQVRFVKFGEHYTERQDAVTPGEGGAKLSPSDQVIKDRDEWQDPYAGSALTLSEAEREELLDMVGNTLLRIFGGGPNTERAASGITIDFLAYLRKRRGS